MQIGIMHAILMFIKIACMMHIGMIIFDCNILYGRDKRNAFIIVTQFQPGLILHSLFHTQKCDESSILHR